MFQSFRVSDSLPKKFPVTTAGWVLAHRMLIADQQKLKDLASAFVAQSSAGVSLTDQQRTAFKNFFCRYTESLHHHHDNEEKVAFPYLCDVKKIELSSCAKVTSDHVSISADLEKLDTMAASIAAGATPPQAEAQALADFLAAFSALDATLVEHFHEEESSMLGPLRRGITPKEQAKHITRPIVGGMGALDRGQYFGKLSPETLKLFMRQEGIPFFVKWIFRANANRYTREFVVPVDEAMAYAKQSLPAADVPASGAE